MANSAAIGTGRRRFVPYSLQILAILVICVALSHQTARCQDQRVAVDSASPAIGNITLEWDRLPSVDVVHSVQTIVSGLDVVAAPAKFSAAMHDLLETLIAAGYRNAAVAPRDFSLHGKTLGCVLHITAGPRAYVTSQEFTGLAHTDTVWLRKLVAMPLNVPLTAAWINEARQRMQGISCLRVIDTPELVPVRSGSPDREDVNLRWRLQESRPMRFDGVVAAGGGSDGGLTGRGSVQLAGLLRRDRSLALNYQRLSVAGTQLSARFTEAGAFGIPLDWGLSLDESEHNDHRQGIAADLRYGVGRAARWRVEGEGHWRKVTPGASAIAPSRTIELSMGLSHYARHAQGKGFSNNPSHFGLMSTFSRRHQFASSAKFLPETIDNRMLLKWEVDQTSPVGPIVSARISAAGRNWVSGSNRLGPGDEWYLGGADALRGYGDREIAAASGAWAAVEIQTRLSASAAVSVFGEGASLQDLNGSDVNVRRRTPYGYGLALWLLSPDRIARLEFAWRDHAAWRDGLVRLRIAQSW